MKRKSVKILLMLFIIVIIFMAFGHNLFAAINSSYGDTAYISNDTNLDEKIAGSSVLETIADFVYAIASWLESLVSKIFLMLTGQNMFPWADKIIFNTLPLLDVNFLNPSNNSLFLSGGSDTSLQTIVKNIYYTILVVAISFLTISVGIMAIKLATSSLAGEKAKYKQAVTNWLFAIVMLFAMHYVIAFIFYLNEEMVKVASKILASNTSNAITDITSNTDMSEVGKAWLNNNDMYINSTDDGMAKGEPTSKLVDVEGNNIWIYELNAKEPYAYSSLTMKTYYNKVYSVILKNTKMLSVLGEMSTDYDEEDSAAITYFENSIGADNNYYKAHDVSNQYNIGKVRTNFMSDLPNNVNGVYTRSLHYFKFMMLFMFSDLQGLEYLSQGKAPHAQDYGIGKEYGFKTIFGDALEDKIAAGKEIQDSELNPEQRYLYNLYKKYYLSEIDDYSSSIVTDLATYFSTSEYVISSGEGIEEGYTKVEKKSLSVTRSILYAVLVIQSILYFYSYIKRFFYIIVLAMMAPVIVVFEFFNKSIT